MKATLPSAGLDADGLGAFFGPRRLGFDDSAIVALSGAHTLGRHASLLGVSKACLRNLTDECILTGTRQPFVGGDPDAFSNE